MSISRHIAGGDWARRRPPVGCAVVRRGAAGDLSGPSIEAPVQSFVRFRDCAGRRPRRNGDSAVSTAPPRMAATRPRSVPSVMHGDDAWCDDPAHWHTDHSPDDSQSRHENRSRCWRDGAQRRQLEIVADAAQNADRPTAPIELDRNGSVLAELVVAEPIARTMFYLGRVERFAYSSRPGAKV